MFADKAKIYGELYIQSTFFRKHLVIGQCQKAPNVSVTAAPNVIFSLITTSSLVSIGQHFITTRVVHFPKRTETSLITEPDQALWAVHSFAKR